MSESGQTGGPYRKQQAGRSGRIKSEIVYLKIISRAQANQTGHLKELSWKLDLNTKTKLTRTRQAHEEVLARGKRSKKKGDKLQVNKTDQAGLLTMQGRCERKVLKDKQAGEEHKRSVQQTQQIHRKQDRTTAVLRGTLTSYKCA